MLSLWLGGIPAHTLGYGRVGGLEVKHVWSAKGGGLDQVTFSLAMPRGYSHPALHQGTLVQVKRGPVSLGWGVMADPNRREWTFVVDGLHRRARHFGADGSTNPRAAVEAANARGLGWEGAGNLPDESISTTSESTAQLNMVSDVLDEYCRLNNKRWGLDAHRRPYVADDPTACTRALTPGVPGMATAADDYLSRVAVRYVVGEIGTPPETTQLYDLATASTTDTPHGPREGQEDLTSLGLLEPELAEQYADALLASQSARLAFTEAVSVAPFQVSTMGGTPPSQWEPMHGRRVKHFGVLDSDGRRAYGKTLEWVVGETTYRPEERSLILAPVDIAARTVAKVQQSNRRRSEVGFT